MKQFDIDEPEIKDCVHSNYKPIQKMGGLICSNCRTIVDKHLKTEWLIKDAINCESTISKNVEEAKKEYTCNNCTDEPTCRYAWDAYNLNGDCLASK